MSDGVIVALVVGATGIIVAVISLMGQLIISQGRQTQEQTRETHLLINSRMTELLRIATELAHAEGVAAGEQSQRDRWTPDDREVSQ